MILIIIGIILLVIGLSVFNSTRKEKRNYLNTLERLEKEGVIRPEPEAMKGVVAADFFESFILFTYTVVYVFCFLGGLVCILIGLS